MFATFFSFKNSCESDSIPSSINLTVMFLHFSATLIWTNIYLCWVVYSIKEYQYITGEKNSELVSHGVFYSAASFVLALDSRLSVCLASIFVVMLNVMLLFVCWIILSLRSDPYFCCPEVTCICWSCDLWLSFWMAG